MKRLTFSINHKSSTTENKNCLKKLLTLRIKRLKSAHHSEKQWQSQVNF